MNRLALSTLALAALALPARADNLDQALLKRSVPLMSKLEEKNYKNVGVLRFQVKKGTRSPSYTAGPLNDNLAERLENALLTALDPKAPLGILRDAGAVAASKAPKAHWNEADAKARAALFAHDYPLHWGSHKVKADAFLTGTAELSADNKQVTVQVRLFDKATNKIEELTKFTVSTDRQILADAGQSFVVSARSLAKARGLKPREGDLALNEDAADSATQRDQQPGAATAANEYLDFEILYDDRVQAPLSDNKDGGELRIDKPNLNAKVTFGLRNKTQDDIGVVIFVNGKSTLLEQTETPEKCLKWVLEPNKGYIIRGFYDEKDKVYPFKVVSKEDEAVKNELGQKLGLIEVFVLRKGSVPTNAEEVGAISTRRMSLRSLSPVQQKKANVPDPRSATTAEQARAIALKSAGLRQSKIARRGDGDYIVKDANSALDAFLTEKAFPNAEVVGTPIVIRYNEGLAP